MIEDMIKRINELAKKKKGEGLTEEEIKEQKELYAIYLKGIREQVRAQLDPAYKPSGHEKCNGCTDHHHHGKCQH